MQIFNDPQNMTLIFKNKKKINIWPNFKPQNDTSIPIQIFISVPLGSLNKNKEVMGENNDVEQC